MILSVSMGACHATENLTSTSQKAQTMNSLVRFVSETQPAVLSLLWTRLRDFAGPQPLTFEPGHLCFGASSESSCPGCPCVQSQDRDRARPLKRRVEVPLRNPTREARDASTAAKKAGVGFAVGQRSTAPGEGSHESPTKPHPPCPLGADVEKRWN